MLPKLGTLGASRSSCDDVCGREAYKLGDTQLMARKLIRVRRSSGEGCGGTLGILCTDTLHDDACVQLIHDFSYLFHLIRVMQESIGETRGMRRHERRTPLDSPLVIMRTCLKSCAFMVP